MNKKVLLVFFISLIVLSALLPSSGSVLASGDPHYYVQGYWPTGTSVGVSGYNCVYDNDIDKDFVAEFITVELQLNPFYYIEVG